MCVIIVIFSVILLGVVLCVLFTLVSHTLYYLECNTHNLSNVECGFPVLNQTLSSFSVSVFFIIVIFIVFDLELLYLVTVFFKSEYSVIILGVIYFTIVIGFVLEWNLCNLTWFV